MASEPLLLEKMRFATIILATSFIIGSIAGPLTPTNNQCSITCIDNKKFIYEIGKSYIYNYVAETTTKLLRDGAQESNIRIQAKVEFELITNCEYVLRLRDVLLEDPNSDVPVIGAKDFRIALERYPLRFGNLDGQIKNVCPDNDEPIWVVNIKRGILSTFQNSMDNLGKEQSVQETDVTGQCLTHYTIEEGILLSRMVIKKSKDLVGCVGRTDHYTSFQSNPYNPKITSKTTPLVNSHHSCEQIISQGKLLQSVCVESHKFQPFSEGKGTGAISTNKQHLELLTEEQGKYADHVLVSKRESLLFDHKYREFGQNSHEKDAENALRNLCEVSSDDFRPETPKLFSRLVHKLQELNYEKLLVVYKNVDEICQGNRKARKFLYDAIPLTGTDAGITLMRDLILNSEVSKSEADNWLLMLSFLPRPSKEIIAACMPLLDNPTEFPKGPLAVSALTHSYCKINPNCGKDIEVKNLVKKLVYHLKKDCHSEDDQQKEIILVTLKALGNIGHIEDALSILNTCYQTVSNPTEVRLAALDAFRRLPCTYKRDAIFETFFKFEEDSEVRIGSYLAILKCPTEDILTKIRENLDSEEVNQVGSFVWTHLTSIQETSDPYKIEIKKILTNRKLQKKFSTDVRKFSRYFEGSAFLDSFKTGALVDGTVVFSPKSYLPRSSTLGLTVDVFGESINLFEVGGRVEGFEFLVESFFGPKGYFPDDTIQKILESARNKNSYDESKLDRIAKIFNVKHLSGEEPRGEMFMRIFGNEVNFMQFRGFEQLLQRSTNGFNILHELIQLTHKEDSEYTKSFMFLDSSLIVPTSIGLPLNLTVNGTATVNLKVGARLDLSQLRSKNLLFKMKVQPSASVEIGGSMVLDAFVTRTGLKMVATMHTSTYANGQIMLKNGEVLKANIDMPKNQMEIFDIQSKVYLLKGQGEKLHAPLVADQINLKKCTGQGISKILGMQLCGEIEFPSVGDELDAPFLPLAGPMSAKIYLLKTDKTLNSYNLEYRWDRQLFTPAASQPYYVRTGRLSLDTPQSTVNRELTAEFVFNERNRTVDILLVSPFKKLSFNGQFLNEKMYKKIDAFVKVDDKERFALQSDLRIDNARNNFRLTPSLSLNVGGRPLIGLRGYVLQQEDRKYSLEMTMDHMTSQPVTLSGFLTKTYKDEKFRYDADFTFGSRPLDLFVKWFMQSDTSSVASKGTIEYSWLKRDKKAITFTSRSSKTSVSNSGIAYNVDADFQSTDYPNHNWALSWNMLRADGQMENKFTVDYGMDKSDSSKLISLQSTYKREGSLLEHKVASTFRILYPAANLDATFEVSHELTKTNLNTMMIWKPKPNRRIALILELNKSADQQELIRGLAQLHFFDNLMELSGNVLQPKFGDFVVSLRGKWAKDAIATAIVTLKKHGPAHKSWGRELSLEMALPGQDPIVLTGDILLNGAEKSIHGEANVNGQQYRTFAEYHRPSLENVRIFAGAKSPSDDYSATGQFYHTDNERSATTDVKLANGRRILTKIHLKRDGVRTDAKASMSLDADRMPDDQYVAQLDFQKLFSGSNGSIVVKFPNQDYNGGVSWNVNAKNSHTLACHGDVWFAKNKLTADGELKADLRPNSRDINASLKISSLFDVLHTVGITIDHSDDGKKWKNNALVHLDNQMVSKWDSQGNFIVLKGGRSIEMEVKLNIPVFEEPIVFSINHTWTRNNADTVLSFGWSADQPVHIAFAFADHSIPDKFHLMLSANLTSPYSWISNIGHASSIIVSDKTFVQSEIHWEDKRILVDYEGSTHLIGDKIDSYSTVQVNTPFQNFETVSSVLRFTMDASSLMTAVDFAWGKERVALELIGTSQTKPFGKNSIASLHFVSPFYPLNDLLLTIEEKHKQALATYDVEVKWAPNQAIVTHLEYHVQTSKDFLVKFDIVEPFNIFHHLQSEIQYGLTANRFLGKLAGTLNKNSVDASADIQKRVNDDGALSLSAMVTLNTPLSEMRNIQMKFEFKNKLSSYDTKMNVGLNGQTMSFTHKLQLTDLTNFYHSLHLNLPEEMFLLQEINLKNAQSMEGRTYKHVSEFSYEPYQKYSMAIDLTASMVPGQNLLNGHLKLDTPKQQYGPFSILATHNTVEKTMDSQFAVEYWPGEIIDISVTVEASPQIFMGRAKLTSPFPGFKSMSVFGNYNLADDEKAGDVNIQWAAEKLIKARMNYRMNGQRINSEIAVSTPFEGYEISNATLAYNGQDTTKMGQVVVIFSQQKVAISASGKMERGKGNLAINVSSPFKGLENFAIATDFDVISLNKKATLKSSSSNIEVTAFHNVRPNSMDSGITFTSAIQGFERVSLGSHFDDIEGIKKSTISLEKGSDLKVHLSANYIMRPQNGYLNIAFTSPIEGLESIQFGSRYKIMSHEKEFTLDLAYEKNALEFKTNFKNPSEGKCQVTTVLTTSCPRFGKMSFDGQYDLKGKIKIGEVTVTRNEKEASLKCELEMSRTKSDVKITMTTPIEGLQDVQFKGSLKQEKDLTNANLLFMKESKMFEVNMLTSVSPMKGNAKITLKSPIDGYKLVSTSVEYEGIRNKREVKFLFEKEQTKATIQGVISRDANVTEISFDITTPINNFKRIGLSGKSDTSRPKSFHTATYRKGEKLYSVTMELLKMPSYFEINLLAKTPINDASFYANYNNMNPNALDFDVKILKEKHMAEIKGRFRTQTTKNINNVEGYVSFNTNYLKMTSVNVGFMYDNSHPLGEEMKLHCNVNGFNNDLTALFNFRDDDFIISLKGTSAYLGWKTFDITAKKLLPESAAAQFQVTININDSPIQVNATVIEMDSWKSKVTFSLTTPYEAYTLIFAGSGVNQTKQLDISVHKGTLQIFDALFRTYKDHRKLDSIIKIHSIFKKLKTLSMSGSHDGDTINANLNFDINGQNLEVDYKRKFGNRAQVDFVIRSSFDLPFVNTRIFSAHMVSDLMNGMAQASLIAEKQEIFNVTLDRSSSNEAVLQFYTPATKEVIIRAQGSSARNFAFEIKKENQIITKIHSEVLPSLLNFEFMTALISDQPLNFFVRCADNAGKKMIATKITRGTDVLEFEASLLVTSVGRVTHFETKLGLKSSFQHWENIQFEMLTNNTSAVHLTMSSSVLWAADQRMHLSFKATPSSGIQCTFTSPFIGYEKMSFIAEQFWDDKEYKCHLAGQWSAMKVGMMITYMPGQVSVMVSSPFRGLESLSALLHYNKEPYETTLIIQTSPEKKIELNANANLEAKKSNWKLSLVTPFAEHASYILEGDYDFTKDHSIKVKAEGQGNKFETKLQCIKDAGRSSHLNLEINTPMEMLKTFTLNAKYGTSESSSEAIVSVDTNGQLIKATGNVARNEDGLNFLFETNIPMPGYERVLISGHSNITGFQRFAELHFKVNDNPMLTFITDVECKLPLAFTAHVTLNTPVGPVQRLRLDSGYANNGEEIKITSKIQWNDEATAIQIESQIKKGEIMAAMTTPFSPIRKVGFNIKIVPNLKHFMILSTGEVEEYKGKVHLEVKNQLPSHYEAKFVVSTPFSQFEGLTSNLVFNAHPDGRLVDAKFLLELPLDGFRKTEATFSFKNNEFKRTEMLIRVNFPQLEYSVKGTMENDDFGNSETLVTIKTPHNNMETVTFRSSFVYVDNAERGVVITFALPNSKHSLRGNYVLKMGNIGFQLGAESILLSQYSPLALQGSYNNNGGSSRLALAFVSAEINRVLTWTQDMDIPSYKEKVSFEKMSNNVVTSAYSLEYMMDLPTASSGSDMNIKVVATQQDGDAKNEVASFAASWKENGRLLDAVFMYNHAESKHSLHAVYKIMDNAIMETSVEIKSPILPSHEVSFSAILNPKEATIKVFIGKVENTISINYKIEASEFQGTLKINMPSLDIKGLTVISKLSSHNSNLKGELTVRALTTIHSVAAYLVHSPKEILFRVNVRTPFGGLNHFMINGHAVVKSDKEVGAVLTTTFRRKVHKLTADIVHDDVSVDAHFKVESPLLKEKELTLQLQLSKAGSNNGNGMIKLISGGVLHKGRFNFAGNNEESTAELLLETPLWNLESLLIKSSVLRHKRERLSANLAVSTPKTTHSLGYQFHQNSTQKNFHLTAYTPFLKSGQFSMTAKAIHEANSNAVELTIHGLETNHTIYFELKKSQLQGVSLLSTLETPIMGIKMISLRASVLEISPRKVDASCELNFREMSHLLNIKTGYESGKVDYSMILQSPLLGIGYISTNGQISIIDRHRVNLDMTLNSQFGQTYTLHGFLQRHPEQGIESRFEITAPGKDPITISAQISRLNFKEFSTNISTKTPLGDHGINMHLRRKDSTIAFLLKLDSSLIPCQSVLLSGNVVLKMQLRLEGSFALETPGKTFRFSSNYKKLDTGNVEGGLTIATPFEILPLLKINGNLGRNNGQPGGFNGSLEIYTVEYGKPEAALYMAFERGSGSPPYIMLKLQVPVLGYPDVSFNYRSQIMEDSSLFNTLKFKVNNYMYGYDSTMLRRPGLRDVEIKGYAGRDTLSMKTTIERNSEGYNINIYVATPIMSLGNIKYSMRYHNAGSGEYVFQNAISFASFRLSFNGELDFVDKGNFNGKALIETTIKGYENVGLKYQRTSKDGHLWGSFEQTFGEIVAVKFLMENYQNGFDGSGKLELVTPFRSLRNADAYYKYDNSHENAISGNLGLTHNGHNVVQVNALSKSGTKIVEILNPIQPVTIEYTYVENGDIVTVTGKYCWDASREIASTIGFNAKITTMKLGREIVVHTIHPSRPLKLTFGWESSERTAVHRGEVSWNDAVKTDSVGFIVETRNNGGHGGKSSYDISTRLRLPMREFELSNHWEKDMVMAKYETAFKWDVTRDSGKMMALAFEHHTLQPGQWATVSFRYPKLNQNLTLRGELKSSTRKTDIFDALLEFIYGKAPSEKFTLRSTLTDHKGYNFDVIAKHPASNLDMKMESSLMNSKDEMRAAVNLDYLDQFGHSSHMELKSKIMKLNNHIHMMLKSHAQQIDVNARLSNLHKGYLMHMDSKLNDNEPITIELQLQNIDGPMATFNAVYDPKAKRSINIRAGMQDMKTILMEAYHHNNSVTIEEMSLLMTLNRSREFITRFNWHPGVLKDIEDGISPIIHSVCTSIHGFMDKLFSSMSHEYRNKLHIVKESIIKTARPIMSSINGEIAEFMMESTIFRQGLLELYKNNEFYIADIYDSITSLNICNRICTVFMTTVRSMVDSFQYAIDSVAITLKGLRHMCETMCADIAAVVHSRIQDIPYLILHYANELNSLGSKTINEVALKGLKFVKDLVFHWIPPMSEWQITSPEWVQRISNKVAMKFQGYVDRFFQGPYYQQLLDNVDQLGQFLQSFYDNEYIKHILRYAQPVFEYFEESIATFLEHPYMRLIVKAADRVSDLTYWAYDFFKVQDRTKDLLGLLIARGEDMALYLVQEMILPEYQLPNLKQDIIFEPNNGKLQILQTLPLMWSSFAEFPNIYDSVEYTDLVNLKDHIIRLPKASMNKLLHAMRSEFSWKHMVPVFRGRALLVGNQHYMTFDGRAYEFAGECSYLLAHDFMDNNFTAIVKYSQTENQLVEKKSFLIIFDGHNIELYPNLTVTVDGERKELPISLLHTRIARTHNALTLTNEVKQIWAHYESIHDIFMLEIGGFYHGKTAGLFGSYDHEPFNDFKTPERKTASKLEEFASSWEIGSKTCLSNRNYAHHSASNSYAIQKPCNDLFSEYETLTPCLRKINPGPYKRMCVNDVSIGKTPCAAAAAYTMMCQANGIAVTVPDTCSECRINNRMVPQGKEIVLEGASVPQSLDVVFVIDNTWQCSTTFPKLRSTLATISRNVEGAVSTIPLNGVRYAVVGFGVGAPYIPQAITANGNIFGSVATVDLAFNNTHFAAGHHHHVAQLIDFAADLPFRAGVGKVMIVVPCAEPTEMYKDYAKLADKLKEIDIKMHVTSIHELILNGINKIKASDVMGFDRDLAFPLKSAERGKLVGDKDLRHQMNIPRNTLTQLALDTDGSVFYASKLASDQPSISILTTEAFSRRVAQNAAPSTCQNCLCSTGPDGMPKAVCSKCYSDELS